MSLRIRSQYIIDAPSVPNDVFDLPCQFEKDGCSGEGLPGEGAGRELDIVSPTSFGHNNVIPPVSKCLH